MLVSSNVYVGFDSASSNNSYNVGGLGARSTVSNGLVSIGAGTIGGGSFNSLTVTNASLVSGKDSFGDGLTIGYYSTNNAVTVLAGSTWNLSGGAIALGFLGGVSNALTINNGIVTNASVVVVGESPATTRRISLPPLNCKLALAYAAKPEPPIAGLSAGVPLTVPVMSV